jgi:hypothetical protein
MSGRIILHRMRPRMSASASVGSMMDSKPLVTTSRMVGGPMPTGMENSATHRFHGVHLMITGTDSAKATSAHFAATATVLGIMIGAERPRRRRACLGPGSPLELTWP